MALALAIGSLCFAFVLAMGLNRLALRSWRRSEGLHWAERARLLNPARKSASLNHWLIPVNLGIFSYSLCPEYSCLYAVLPSFVGVSLANYFMSREIFPELNFKSWLHLFAAALIIFFIGWVVLFVAIIEMPDNFGWKTWVFAGTVFLLLLALNFGLGIRILKWFRLIEPATPHLQSLVNEVSDKMGVPVRATWILSAQLSNAAAFPQTKQLVFTSKLLETCADDEIKSFCAHELGHLNESRKVLFMRLLVSMAFVPL